MPINKYLILLLPVTILLASCNRSSDRVIMSTDSTGNIESIYLNEKIIDPIGLQYTQQVQKESDNSLLCTGSMIIEPENKTVIPSPVSGRINHIYVSTGQFVKTGTKLTGIENTDFIVMQQAFLEARNKLDFYKDEYTRQGDLTVENATSVKKMQTARLDYQSAELSYQALGLQLKILGISPDSLRIDNLLSALPVIVSRSGVVSEILIRSGSHVDKGDPLFALITRQSLRVQLQIPEKTFGFVQTGQKVDCSLAYDSLTVFKARILSLIPSIDPESHMAVAFAELSGAENNLVSGMTINARIHGDPDTINLINSKAILHEKQEYFIFAREKGLYVKVPVKVGSVFEGHSEVIGLPRVLSDSIIISNLVKLNSYFSSQ